MNLSLTVILMFELSFKHNSGVSLGQVTPPGYPTVKTHGSSRGGAVGVS